MINTQSFCRTTKWNKRQLWNCCYAKWSQKSICDSIFCHSVIRAKRRNGAKQINRCHLIFRSNVSIGCMHINNDCRLCQSTGSTEYTRKIAAWLFVQFVDCLHRTGSSSDQWHIIRATISMYYRWLSDLLWIFIIISLVEHH